MAIGPAPGQLEGRPSSGGANCAVFHVLFRWLRRERDFQNHPHPSKARGASQA
jgi:hypothetical protein